MNSRSFRTMWMLCLGNTNSNFVLCLQKKDLVRKLFLVGDLLVRSGERSSQRKVESLMNALSRGWPLHHHWPPTSGSMSGRKEVEISTVSVVHSDGHARSSPFHENCFLHFIILFSFLLKCIKILKLIFDSLWAIIHNKNTRINTGGCAAPFILPVFIFAVNVDRCEEFRLACTRVYTRSSLTKVFRYHWRRLTEQHPEDTLMYPVQISFDEGDWVLPGTWAWPPLYPQAGARRRSTWVIASFRRDDDLLSPTVIIIIISGCLWVGRGSYCDFTDRTQVIFIYRQRV